MHTDEAFLAGDDAEDRPLSQGTWREVRQRAKSPEVRRHRPPKFDLNGFPIPPHRGSGVKVRKGMPGAWSDEAKPGEEAAARYNNAYNKPLEPGAWRKQPRHKTHGDLEAARRLERRPDPSFDLDGDGTVSGLDYFFAQQFDRDEDGKLNAEERAAALSALREGYANNYYVVQATAVTPFHRVMQRRGQILAEDRGHGWADLQRTFAPEELRGPTETAPFAVNPTEGPERAVEEDEQRRSTRLLSRTLGVRTRTDLLRARRVLDHRSLNAAAEDFDASLRRMEQAEEEEGPGGIGVSASAPALPRAPAARDDDALSLASSVDERVKPITNTLHGGRSGELSRRALLSRRKEEARHQGAAALGMSEAELEGPRPGVAAVTLRLQPDQHRRTMARTAGSAQTSAWRTGVDTVYEEDGAADDPDLVRDPLRTRAITPPEQRSLTRTELRRRRRADQARHGLGVAPENGLGVHGTSVPSFDETLTRRGRTWFQESPPRTQVPTPWARGSLLERPFDTHASGFGRVASVGGRRVDAETGEPLVKSGLQGETSTPRAVTAFKERTTALFLLPQVRKRRGRDIPDNPAKHDPWAVARAEGRPATVGPTHTLRRWTDDVIAYRQAMEEDEVGADDQPYYEDPAEHAPLFSSFAGDRIFRDTWNERRTTALRERQRELVERASSSSPVRRRAAGRTPQPKRRRRSVYGTPIVMHAGGRSSVLARGAAGGGEGEEGGVASLRNSRTRRAPASRGMALRGSQSEGVFRGVAAARADEAKRQQRSRATLETLELAETGSFNSGKRGRGRRGGKGAAVRTGSLLSPLRAVASATGT